MTRKKAVESGVLKVKLTVAERSNVASLLPIQGGIGTVRIANNLRERLDLTKGEAEIVAKFEGDENLPWDEINEAVGKKGFSFNSLELSLVVNALRKLNEDEELQPFHVPLWDKFIEVEDGGNTEE